MSMGQGKKLSFRQELNLWPSVHQSDALSTELQRTLGELGHTQGSCMTCVLRAARISSVETGERVCFNLHWDGELLIQQKDTLVRKKLLMYEIKSLSIPLSVFLTSSLVRLFNCDFHFEHFWAKLNIWNVFISQDCFSSCPVLTHTRRWISGQCPLMSHLRRYVDIINWLFHLKWDYTTSFFCKPYFLLLLRKQSNKNQSPKHSSTLFLSALSCPRQEQV